ASGNLGAEAVAQAEPDGYTLLAAQPAPLTTNIVLYKKLNFDPAAFEPLAIMISIPNTLVVRLDFPASSVAELIAYAKANPGKVNSARKASVPRPTSPANCSRASPAPGSCTCHIAEPPRR